MDQDQQRSLHMLGGGFTTDEASAALDWTGSRKGLAYQLKALGYETRMFCRPGEHSARKIWIAPIRSRDECTCRCHTGTCGENDMVLAERAIRLIEKLRPLGADTINAISDLVHRAGVDFARAALPIGGIDDDLPF
jgi:hypothetical protein